MEDEIKPDIEDPIDKSTPDEVVEDKKEVEGKSVIDEAKELRDENKQILEDMKKENARTEKLQSDKILAGKSTPNAPVEKSDHQKYLERTKDKYKGTGRDPTKGYERQF